MLESVDEYSRAFVLYWVLGVLAVIVLIITIVTYSISKNSHSVYLVEHLNVPPEAVPCVLDNYQGTLPVCMVLAAKSKEK